VNNILKIVLIFIFLTSCSFQKNSKIWTNKKIKETKQDKAEDIFKKEMVLQFELNPSLKISLYSKPINKSFLNNFDNNNGRINYSSNLENISKLKFSKKDNFHQHESQILFHKNNIIFFENKGSILKYDEGFNLVWKNNHYTKSEKKQKPILFFTNNQNVLIVADNLAKYYAVDINNGELLWNKVNTAPFNSQIKIFKDKFFVIDYENTLRAFSIKNGKEIWNIKTQKSLIKSQKKLSIVIVEDKLYFNNSLGDISSVDIDSGELIWQRPTQSSFIFDDGFFLKTSDIIADKNTLYFSNNKNQFFSIDIKSGTLNWEQKINSNLRPTLIDNYLFAVSLKGYLIIIDKFSGKIIRITDLFKNIKIKKREKIEPNGFVVAKDNIYLTTNHGRLLVIDIATGVTKSTIKIDNNKISRPAILNQNLFIITDNAIIKLN